MFAVATKTKRALLAAVLLALQETGIEVITESYPDGSARSRCEAVRDASGALVRHGLYECWYPDGRLESKGTFVEGLEHGEWELSHPNGKRAAWGSFERGLRTGPWRLFTDGGRRNGRVRTSRAGAKASGECFTWKPGLVIARTVHFQVHEFREPGSGWTWAGESADGLKHGPWRALRSNGTTALAGEYAYGVPTGPWSFFYGDGTFDGGWFSAVYENGRPVQPLLEPPANGARNRVAPRRT